MKKIILLLITISICLCSCTEQERTRIYKVMLTIILVVRFFISQKSKQKNLSRRIVVM